MKKISALLSLFILAPTTLILFQNCTQGLSSDLASSKLNTGNSGSGASSPSADSSPSCATTNTCTTTTTPPVVTNSPDSALSGYKPTTTTGMTSGKTLGTSSRVNWYNMDVVVSSWDFKASYPSRSACAQTEGAVFEVGPNKAYTRLSEVPWLNLAPCDVVNIYYSAQPYTDLIFIGVHGLENKWITIQGIPNSNGDLPILDGSNAIMPIGTGADQWVDTSGLIMIKFPHGDTACNGGQCPGTSANYKPGYIHITGLELRNANVDHQVTNLSNTKAAWPDFSSGIYVNGADHIAITYNKIHNNMLGVFINSTAGARIQTSNVLIAHNYIFSNSYPGSFGTHNSYTEAIGTVYEYNYFGPTLSGSNGDCIKDRSAGNIFRYNYISGGADNIALRDPESNGDYEKLAKDSIDGRYLYQETYIYGNIFLTDHYIQSVIGWGDGAASHHLAPRVGDIYFYNNIVISKVDNQGFWSNNNYYDTQGNPLFDNASDPAAGSLTVHAYNNIFYATSNTPNATAAPFALFYYQGSADFQNNWINNFVNHLAIATDGNLSQGVPFNGGAGLNDLTAVMNNNKNIIPDFTDVSTGNYSLKTNNLIMTSNQPVHSAVAARSLFVTAKSVTSP